MGSSDELLIIIRADDAASEKLKGVGKELGEMKKSSGGAADAFQQLTGVSLTGVGAIMSIGAALKFSTDAAFEAQQATAATEAVIKSTGGAAGMTADEIVRLASAESALTGIDGEVVQNGENMLLTFKNIGEDVFPRATRAMEDMAAAMAKGDMGAIDLQGTAIQLGKALNDPITGITALTRVGVTFTEQQKETIRTLVETGQAAEAQKIILAELESEFGGMAEAMGNTDAGKIQKAKNALEDLAATVGARVIPVLGDAAQSFATLASMGTVAGDALADHDTQMLKTSDGYRDYVAEMIRATVVAKGMTSVDVEKVTQMAREKDNIDDLIRYYGIKTQAQYEEARATVEAVQRGEELNAYYARASTAVDQLAEKNRVLANDALAATKEAMKGVIGDAMEEYNNKQDDLIRKKQELITKLGELQDKAGSSWGQQRADAIAASSDVREQIRGINASLEENAAKWEEKKNRILFSILEEQIAIQNEKAGIQVYTTEQAQMLDDLAQKWGLADQATATATNDIIAAVAEAQKTGNWSALYGKIDTVSDKLNAIPTNINVRINVEQVGSIHVGSAAEASALNIQTMGHGPTASMTGGAGGLVTKNTSNDNFGPPRAAGGPVAGGEAYVWNEPGADGEVLVPAGNGYVLSRTDAMSALANAFASGGGSPITINFNGAVIRQDQDIRDLAQAVVREIQGAQ